MEKFMLLFRGSEAYQQSQPPEVLEDLKIKMMQWVGNLFAKGIHVGSEPFYRSGKQVNGSGRTVTDAPYGEEAEIIGGCTIILAENMDEAVDVARACPILDTNATIEIRPIQSIL